MRLSSGTVVMLKMWRARSGNKSLVSLARSRRFTSN